MLFQLGRFRPDVVPLDAGQACGSLGWSIATRIPVPAGLRFIVRCYHPGPAKAAPAGEPAARP
jgi:hypothetical protein